MTAKRLAILGLSVVLLLDVWWRSHTISGTVRDALGVAPWPVVAEAEPLDCDECIYAYIGKRMVAGDVLYRDLTENKPPLGYGLYATAVALGGAREVTIRLMPVPMVLVTIALVWGIAGRLAGPVAAVLSAFVYALMSTDPYLYGNGANMEHAINLLGTTALWAYLRGRSPRGRRWLVVAGALVAAAGMVKQVAILPLAAFLAAAMAGEKTGHAGRSPPLRDRLKDASALFAGAAIVAVATVAILAYRGALVAAIDDVVRYGGALATSTPADPKEYPFFVRWIVGNTDPEGRLPWPFGKTAGRAWWAAGCWPLWAVSFPALAWFGLRKAGKGRRLVAAWTVAAWIAVAAPGLFWQHYFLLPLPGVAILVAIACGDAMGALRDGFKIAPAVAACSLLAATAGTVAIQVRDYLLVPPDLLTTRYKGGGQWVALRLVGRELEERTRGWESPRLWVWGIQSPLYFYSGIDTVTPQVFADPLIVAFAASDHPLIRPRIARTMSDLEAARPDLIFVGEKPFPELEAFLKGHYRASRLRTVDAPIWVRGDRLARFEAIPGPT